MILLNKNNFKQFCLDIIQSDVHLTEVIKNETEAGLMVIYCESSKYNELTKKYPDKEKLYDFIAKNKNESYFHLCSYDKKKKLLVIDGGKISDVIFR